MPLAQTGAEVGATILLCMHLVPGIAPEDEFLSQAFGLQGLSTQFMTFEYRVPVIGQPHGLVCLAFCFTFFAGGFNHVHKLLFVGLHALLAQYTGFGHELRHLLQ